MASMPITDWSGEPVRFPVPALKLVATEATQVAAATAPRLSSLEWSIVALAERDNLASLREPGRVAAALESLFGFSRPNRLADPRLESLRRVAVHAWRSPWNVPKSELLAFVESGFSIDHYELIQTSIAKSRQNARRRNNGR